MASVQDADVQCVSVEGVQVTILDSISQVDARNVGQIVVCGSHGGGSSANFALAAPPRFVVFNDAGVGKEEAGIAGLVRLQEAGIPAAVVSNASARIGEALDTLSSGIISHANGRALAHGVRPGQSCREAISHFAERP